MISEKKWFAVYTNPRCEKKVSEFLTRKDIENYCPLNKVQKQWSDRKKIILEPLFTSYVFVRISQDEFLSVRQTPGILNFVYWLNKPAVIRAEEIDIIKKFLYRHDNVKLEKIEVHVYDTVKVLAGPFMEQIGSITTIKNKTVKIVLASLGYLMTAEISTTNIELLSKDGASFGKLLSTK